jgi:excisionase family DNA binding protein
MHPSDSWISRHRAAGLLGVSPGTLQKLIDSGRLSVRAIPGGVPRLRTNEVLELASISTRERKGG